MPTATQKITEPSKASPAVKPCKYPPEEVSSYQANTKQLF